MHRHGSDESVSECLTFQMYIGCTVVTDSREPKISRLPCGWRIESVYIRTDNIPIKPDTLGLVTMVPEKLNLVHLMLARMMNTMVFVLQRNLSYSRCVICFSRTEPFNRLYCHGTGVNATHRCQFHCQGVVLVECSFWIYQKHSILWITMCFH